MDEARKETDQVAFQSSQMLVSPVQFCNNQSQPFLNADENVGPNYAKTTESAENASEPEINLIYNIQAESSERQKERQCEDCLHDEANADPPGCSEASAHLKNKLKTERVDEDVTGKGEDQRMTRSNEAVFDVQSSDTNAKLENQAADSEDVEKNQIQSEDVKPSMHLAKESQNKIFDLHTAESGSNFTSDNAAPVPALVDSGDAQQLLHKESEKNSRCERSNEGVSGSVQSTTNCDTERIGNSEFKEDEPSQLKGCAADDSVRKPEEKISPNTLSKNDDDQDQCTKETLQSVSSTKSTTMDKKEKHNSQTAQLEVQEGSQTQFKNLDATQNNDLVRTASIDTEESQQFHEDSTIMTGHSQTAAYYEGMEEIPSQFEHATASQCVNSLANFPYVDSTTTASTDKEESPQLHEDDEHEDQCLNKMPDDVSAMESTTIRSNEEHNSPTSESVGHQGNQSQGAEELKNGICQSKSDDRKEDCTGNWRPKPNTKHNCFEDQDEKRNSLHNLNASSAPNDSVLNDSVKESQNETCLSTAGNEMDDCREGIAADVEPNLPDKNTEHTFQFAETNRFDNLNASALNSDVLNDLVKEPLNETGESTAEIVDNKSENRTGESVSHPKPPPIEYTDLEEYKTVPARINFRKGHYVDVFDKTDTKSYVSGVCQWFGYDARSNAPCNQDFVGVEVEKIPWKSWKGDLQPFKFHKADHSLQWTTKDAIIVPLQCLKTHSAIRTHRKAEKEAFKNLPDKLKDIDPSCVQGFHPPSSPLQTGLDCGIQGQANSCYMDAALFAMFACNDTFDFMFHQPKSERDGVNAIIEHLLTRIVNPLRKTGFVSRASVMQFREQFQQIANTEGMTNAMKDAEEFITILLDRILKTPPFLKFTDNDTCNLYQLFFWSDTNESVLSVQKLLQLSMEFGQASFAEMPLNMVMLIPREGSKYIMFNCLELSLDLDLTDFTPTHSHSSCSQPQELSTDAKKMELYAVLCIHTSHFVTFVRDPARKKWHFFDSMYEREGGVNRPYIEEIPQMEEYIIEYNNYVSRRKCLPDSMDPLLKKLIRTAYILFYRHKRFCFYK